MGNFGKQLLTAAGDGLTGGLASGLSGAVGGIFGLIGAKKRMKDLAKYQAELQKQLNEQAAELNYEYGEKAAQNAYARQMEMYNRSYADQSYSAMREQMEDAGLNVGLMYGGSGGSGGGAGSTSGAPHGATGGAQAGQAANAAEVYMAEMQERRMNLETYKAKAEIENINASTKELEARAEEARASAARQTEAKITEVQSRDYLIEKLRNEGLAKWIENIQEMWRSENGPTQDNGVQNFKNGRTGWKYGIASTSYLNKEEAANLAKAVAEADKASAEGRAADALEKLNSARAEGYWKELLNATIIANAQDVEAAAKKLAAEWETGEYTNWKTWADIAGNVIGNIAGTTKFVRKF